jgi:predicted ATPase
MIKSLTIKNFKSIKSLELELGHFNLLCGENASGKTSTIHALLSVIQRNDDKKSLDGDLVKIGTLEEVKTKGAAGNVEVQIKDEKGHMREIILQRTAEGEETENLEVKSNPKNFNIDFEKNLFYLSSNRVGVVDTYTKGDQKFGTSGASFVEFFDKNKGKRMPQSFIDAFIIDYFNEHSSLANDFIETYIKFWFEDISKETIKIVPVKNTNQYVLTYGGNEREIRATNTGSGFSYVLPIVALCLGAIAISNGECPTIIIENPEVYLHPDAQKRLMKFLMFVSKHTQLIIETHSDHVLKEALEGNRNNQIVVFNLKNKESSMTLLTQANFKTHPISYAEVQYKAFGILASDLHIILYGQLHNKFIGTLSSPIPNNKFSIKYFDQHYLESQNDVPLKAYTYNKTTYKTLPTYIRNCIDHPNSTHNYTDEELKTSVDFMLSKL